VRREEPHPAGHKRSSLVLVGGAASGGTKNCVCEHSTSLIVTQFTHCIYFYLRGNGFESPTISISWLKTSWFYWGSLHKWKDNSF